MNTGSERQPYERLIAWQRAHALFLEVHRVTRWWPTEERYGLTSQVRRAAFSVPANLVEGNAKRGPAELRRYLDIAIGSLAEVRYALRAATDLGYCTKSAVSPCERLAEETGRCLFGLLRSLNRARGPR